MKGIKIIKKIGSGSYGNVFQAYDEAKKTYRAVKCFKDNFASVKQCMKEPEVKIMTKIKHRNLVPLKKVIYEDNKLYLIMELWEKNLAQMFEERRKSGQKFTEKEIKTYMRDIIEGVKVLHDHGYMHRDVKPENILISQDNVLKLTDFGTIKKLSDRLNITHYVSTRWYRAPEWILEVEKYDEKSDVFAVGWVFAEFFTLKPLFWGSSSKDQLMKYLKAMGIEQVQNWKEGLEQFSKLWLNSSDYENPNLSNLIPNISKRGMELLSAMLNLDPSKRPSLKESLEHQFFEEELGLWKVISPRVKDGSLISTEDSFSSKPNNVLLSRKNEEDRFAEEKESAKRVIKKHLINKINQLNKLDLSRVAEADAESSFDFSPKKYACQRHEKQRSRFNQYQVKLGEPTLRVSDIDRSPQFNSTSANSLKFGQIKFSSSLKDLHREPIGLNNKRVLHKMETDELSTMNSRKSNLMSFSGIDNSQTTSQLESSDNELDILRKQVDQQKSASLPVSLKYLPPVQSRYSSRVSQSISRANCERESKVDKYFTDINGQSLISTLTSSKDLFAKMSTLKTSRRSSALRSDRSSTRITTGNQVLFGGAQANRGDHHQFEREELTKEPSSSTQCKWFSDFKDAFEHEFSVRRIIDYLIVFLIESLLKSINHFNTHTHIRMVLRYCISNLVNIVNSLSDCNYLISQNIS
jgi:male germ cell-associated kinase